MQTLEFVNVDWNKHARTTQPKETEIKSSCLCTQQLAIALSGLAHLHTLEFSHCITWNEIDINAFVHAWSDQSPRRLHRFSITHSSWASDHITKWMATMNPDLQHLVLGDERISQRIQPLVHTFASFKCLTTLNLIQLRATDACVDVLQDWIRKQAPLRTLSIRSSYGISDTAMERLVNACIDHPSLIELGLFFLARSDKRPFSQAVGAALGTVAGGSHIRHLFLENLQLNTNCMMTFCGMLASTIHARHSTGGCAPSLEELSLAGNPLGSIGMAELCARLCELTSLLSLDLSQVDMGSTGALALAWIVPLLPSCLCLKALNNDLTPESTTALLTLSLRSQSLRRLELDDAAPCAPASIDLMTLRTRLLQALPSELANALKTQITRVSLNDDVTCTPLSLLKVPDLRCADQLALQAIVQQLPKLLHVELSSTTPIDAVIACCKMAPQLQTLVYEMSMFPMITRNKSTNSHDASYQKRWFIETITRHQSLRKWNAQGTRWDPPFYNMLLDGLQQDRVPRVWHGGPALQCVNLASNSITASVQTMMEKLSQQERRIRRAWQHIVLHLAWLRAIATQHRMLAASLFDLMPMILSMGQTRTWSGAFLRAIPRVIPRSQLSRVHDALLATQFVSVQK